jgi:hypothetical protein
VRRLDELRVPWGAFSCRVPLEENAGTLAGDAGWAHSLVRTPPWHDTPLCHCHDWRRWRHPAVECISLGAQPASLRFASRWRGRETWPQERLAKRQLYRVKSSAATESGSKDVGADLLGRPIATSHDGKLGQELAKVIGERQPEAIRDRHRSTEARSCLGKPRRGGFRKQHLRIARESGIQAPCVTELLINRQRLLSPEPQRLVQLSARE